MHGCASHVARLPHMAAHSAHGHDELGQIVRIVDAGRGGRYEKGYLVILAHGPRQTANGIRRRPADRTCPFGCLGRVVVGTQHVVLEVR